MNRNRNDAYLNPVDAPGLSENEKWISEMVDFLQTRYNIVVNKDSTITLTNSHGQAIRVFSNWEAVDVYIQTLKEKEADAC